MMTPYANIETAMMPQMTLTARSIGFGNFQTKIWKKRFMRECGLTLY